MRGKSRNLATRIDSLGDTGSQLASGTAAARVDMRRGETQRLWRCIAIACAQLERTHLPRAVPYSQLLQFLTLFTRINVPEINIRLHFCLEKGPAPMHLGRARFPSQQRQRQVPTKAQTPHRAIAFTQ